MEIKGFTKLNEAVSSELLKDEELTKLEDAVLSEKTGKPKKRGGWAKFNTNQVDSAGNISSLHEVVTSNGSNYLLAGINGKLRKSLNGTATWTDVTDKGTPPYKMQAYADRFIFTDGLVPPFLVSGDTLGTTVDLQITAPDITSVTTGQNSGGNLEASKAYKWMFVYITATGEVSPPSIPISAYYLDGTSFAHTTNSTYKRVGFQGLPVSSDTRVNGRMIFRTMGNGEVYYFHSLIDNIITTWFDDTSDNYLGSETFSFLNVSKIAKFVTLHKERIIFGNIKRTVKNWIMPPYSNDSTSAFNVTFGGITHTFSKTSPNGINGIKDCQPMLNGTIAGTLTAGDYTYRFIFYDKEGLMSDPMDSNIVSIDGSTYTTIAIATPPQIASGYDAITKAEIYRKKDSGNFELVKTYDPRNLSLSTVVDAYNGLTIEGLFDIGWTASTTYTTNQVVEEEKSGLAFSEIGQPATFVLENVRNVFPDDGDEITGIYDDQDGILIFKVRSICKIYTGQGSPDNWRLVKSLTNIGCDEPNSLLKYGNDYIFSHQKQIYSYNSGQGLKNIGLEIKESLKLVTAYHCATANDEWYIIGVTGAGLTSGYGFLIYDKIVESWYKFNITSIPYVLKIKEQGTYAGTILTSNADYILKYSTAGVDSNTGTDVDITPVIRTKTFGGGIALERLRKIRFNYKKTDGKTLTITVTNPDTLVTNTHADTTDSGNSSDYKLYEDPIGESDALKVTEKFYINLTGAGFNEWGILRLETYPILRGKRETRR